MLLGVSVAIMDLPWLGVSWTFAMSVALFVAANLALVISLSFIARNQMQAMQLGIFFYLPSMLLSGFMFSFYGMPNWARALGELLPLTHFLRIVRGVLLKQLPDDAIWSLSVPLLVFTGIMVLIGAVLYRRQ